MIIETWLAWLRRVRQNLTDRPARGRHRPRRGRPRPGLEWLEDRTLLSAATFSESGHQLTLGLVASEQLSVVSQGTSYTFTLAAGDTWTPIGSPSSSNVTASNNVLTVKSAGIAAYTSGIVVGDSGSSGGDSVAFLDSGANAYSNDFFITLGHSSSGASTPGLSFSQASAFTAPTNNFQISGDINVNSGATLSCTNIQLTTTGTSAPVRVNGTISATGNVTLTSTGAITQTAAITASGLTATAAAGVTLTNSGNSVAAFTASDTASGDIDLTTQANVSIGGITQSGGGAVSVLSTGSNTALTVNGNVTTAGGSVTLQATGNVTVAANETVSSGTGLVTLGAGLTAAGAGDDGVGALTVGAHATVTSINSSSGAMRLRGADVSIDPTATVGEPSGATTPTATLTGLSVPTALAFDGSGNLYVANAVGTTNDTVSVFASGSTTSSATLTGLDNPVALAFDGSGKLYVANAGNNTVSVFTSLANNATPSATLTGLNVPAALAFDHGGHLFVANFGSGGSGTTVSEFTSFANNATPSSTLIGLSSPAALAFDSAGHLFVANTFGTTVSEFTSFANNATPSSTLTGLSGPAALAFDNGGDLFVANYISNTVSEFTSFANNATPSSTLTGLTVPQSLALDPSGNLYVANSGNDTVSRFTPGASTPSTMFTGLGGVSALAFVTSGNLYAANRANGTVSQFTVPGQAGGVVIQSSVESRPMLIGGSNSSPVSGINLSSTELGRIATIPGGTVTIGDSSQTGNITFAGAVTATSAGASTIVAQSASGGGQIVLDASSGIALDGNGGLVSLTPGTGGISGNLSATNALLSSNGFTASGLSLTPVLTFAPSAGEQVTLVSDSGGPIGGTFSGLTQGGTTTLSYSGTNYKFYVRYDGGAGNDLVLIYGAPPAVTTPPKDQTATAGTTATFTAAASGVPTPSVQWQVSSDGGSTYGPISGATSTTLSVPSVTVDMNGYEYEAVFTNSISTAVSTAAALTVNFAPSVTTQPNDQTVTAGATATFMAAADGRPSPTVQWQVSTDGGSTFSPVAGATSTTLTLSSVTSAMTGYKYEAVFTNSVGSATSTAATLTVNYAPSVTTQPTNQSANAGGSATFTAAASGFPAPTVQWQVSTNGGTSFSPISGATSTVLTLNNVIAAMNGNEYEAVFTNSVGSATSTAATLTVFYSPRVTTQPMNQSANAGGTATFTAAASGNPTPSVQWQVSTNNGGTFSNVSGATLPTLTLNNVTAAMNGYQYQAVFNNGGANVTTSAATLTVNYAPSVTTQPTNQSANAGNTATFTAAASGNPTPTVQWQVSTNGGTSFSNVPGATSTTLTLTGVTAAMNGNEYEAVFTNSVGSATSSAVTLTVNYAPSVTTQPTNQSANAGVTATFTAAASGNPTPSVQWQVSTDGGTSFSNVPGATSTALALPGVTAAMNGNKYEAVFTNSVGSAISTAATLTVNFALSVTTQPSNQSASAGGTATFTAAASGNPAPTVQWQVSTNGGTSFSNVPGATSTTLALPGVTAAMNGNEYEAVFTNSIGSATSAAATLTVNNAPTVTTQPNDQSASAGGTATFTAAASGNPTPTVQWQVSTNGGASFSNIAGATSTTLTLTNVTGGMNGNKYEAVFTNSVGSATSTAATLAVSYAPSVTTQPTNQSASAGGTATFTAAASGNPTPTVQWQVSTNGGTSFSNIAGATSTTLTLTGVTAAMNGNEYEAVFTSSAGSATSTAATLAVNYAPSVTTQPTDQSANAGGAVTFTAAASGNPTPTVQWQVSTNGGTSFSNVPGAASPTLTLTNLTAGMTGNKYEAVFTNGLGSATTSAATLTVNSPPTVTPNTASLPATASMLVIQGTGFDTVAAHNMVVFTGGVTGTVTSSRSSTLTVTGLSQLTGGPLFASVSVNGLSSGAAVEVAVVTPVVTANSASLLASATTLTITGTGFDASAGNDVVSFNGGAFGVVTTATATRLTVTALTGLIGGSLLASVQVDGAGSGAAVQVATVTPVLTSSAGVLAANSHSLTINGFGFDPTTTGDTIAFSGAAVGTVTSATATQLNVTSLTGLTAGPLTASVLIDGVGSGSAVPVALVAPVVTSSTAKLSADGTTLTINGVGFDTTAANDVVTFGGGATGTVSSATSTQLNVTGVVGLVGGPLTASVSADGVGSGAAVLVASVTPVLTVNTATLPATSSTLVINGYGFDPTAANDSVTFGGGVTGTVTSATNTSLTVTGLTGLGVAPLFASVSVDNVSRTAVVQVATVAAVITPNTTAVPASATTLTITGFAFDPTPTHDLVTLSGGATGTVTAATSTQLTVTGVIGLVAGPLSASLLVNGVSSGPPVQIAVVTPVATPNTARLLNNATSLVITGFGFSTTPANNTVSFSGGVTGVVSAATLSQLTVTSLSGVTPANGLPLGGLTATVTSNGAGSGTAVQVATVVQDAVSPSQTTVTATPAGIQAGGTATVTLTARDAGGLQVPGSESVVFGLGTGTGGGSFSSASTTGDGTFTATFTGGRAGSNTITATVNGVLVTSAPPTITVSPGPVSASQSTVTITPTAIQPDGQASATLTARDAYNNQESAGGLTVTFGVGPGVGVSPFAPVQDNGDGTYSTTFTAINAGSNTIVAFINGQAVTSTAPAFTVPPGPAGAISTDLPLFTWLPVTGASSYTITVADQTAKAQSPLVVGKLTGTSYRLTAQQALTPGHTYLWYLGATVGNSLNKSGPTQFAIALPTQTGPARNSTIAASNGYDRPTFTWTSFTDAIGYKVYLFDATTNRLVFNTNVGNVTSYRVPAALAVAPGHSYIWQVGLSTHTGLTWSTNDTFALALPQMSLAANSTIAASSGYDLPTLTWAALTGATSYSLRVQDTTSGKVPVNQSVGNATSYTLTAAQALTPGDSFVWTISPNFNGFVSHYGPQAFSLASVQLTPGNNSTIPKSASYLTPTFTWVGATGATSYVLSLVDATTNKVVTNLNVGNLTAYASTVVLTAGHRYTWRIGIVYSNGVVYDGPDTFTLAP